MQHNPPDADGRQVVISHGGLLLSQIGAISTVLSDTGDAVLIAREIGLFKPL